MHALIGALPEFHWTVWLREHPTASWSVLLAKANRLELAVDAALDVAFKPDIKVDVTFSTRPVEQVAVDLIETPEHLAAVVRNVACTVLCKEGRLATPLDRWATIYRPANSAEMLTGLDFVFQPQTLKTQVARWFEGEGWHTFGPPRPHRSESAAPHYPRELLVRHGDDWRARAICPSSFPQFRPGPVITPEQAARRISRMPQTKSAVRRAKHQENDARFKAEAAERAKLREEAAAE